MKQHNLFLMCGVPGSGKSTWLKNNIDPDNSIVISRDAIRFEMVQENEEYFSKEKQVFRLYVDQIQCALDDEDGPENIYCDATHINKASRDKILNALDLTNAKNVTVIVVRPALPEILRRNDLRSGRDRVPRSVVRRMWYQFERPEEDWPRVFDTMYVEVPMNDG